MRLKKCILAGGILLSTAVLFACGNKAGKEAETTAAVSTDAEKTAETEKNTDAPSEGNKLKIVTTNFPSYDFARAITKEDAEVTMLVKPGAETHSFEPSPQDIITIQNADLFIYTGGDSDEWVDGILESVQNKNFHVFKMMDAVNLIEEETVEGMQEEEHEHDHADADHGNEEADHDHEKADQAEEHEEEGPEMDEHVWTSPKNAITIVEKLEEILAGLDESHKDSFKTNSKSYIKEIEELDKSFKEVVDSGKRKEIIVADRFPFAYFCKEYGLSYFAAFPGCSTDTQPSAATIAFLTDKVKEDKIPVVFHIEMGNEDMVNAISKDTGAKKLLLNSVHNVTDSDFKAGKTYVDLMKPNVEALKEALN